MQGLPPEGRTSREGVGGALDPLLHRRRPRDHERGGEVVRQPVQPVDKHDEFVLEPEFDALRRDPAFQRLLARVRPQT